MNTTNFVYTNPRGYENPKEETVKTFKKLNSGMFFIVQIGRTLKYRLLFVVSDSKKDEGILDVIELSKNINKEKLLGNHILEKDVYVLNENDNINIIKTGDTMEYYIERQKWEQKVNMWNHWNNEMKIDPKYQGVWVLLFYQDGNLEYKTEKNKSTLLDFVKKENISIYLILNANQD